MDSKEYIALNELYNSLVFGLFSEIENQIFLSTVYQQLQFKILQ